MQWVEANEQSANPIGINGKLGITAAMQSNYSWLSVWLSYTVSRSLTVGQHLITYTPRLGPLSNFMNRNHIAGFPVPEAVLAPASLTASRAVYIKPRIRALPIRSDRYSHHRVDPLGVLSVEQKERDFPLQRDCGYRIRCQMEAMRGSRSAFWRNMERGF